MVSYPSCQRLVSWDAHCCCSCHSFELSVSLVRHSLLFEDCRLFSDYNWCCTVCRACVNVTDYSCQVFLGFFFMCAVISSGGQVLPV